MSRVGVQTCPRSRRGAVSGCPPHGTGSCGARARPGVAPSQLSPAPPRTRRAELCPPPRGGAATQACRSPPPARRGPAPRAAANSCLPLPGGRGDRAFRWAWPVDPPPRRGRGLRALRAGHAGDAPGLRGRLAAPGRTGPGAGPLRVGGARAGLAAAHGLRHGRQGVQQPHPEEGPVDCEPSGRRLLVQLRTNGLRSRTPGSCLMSVSPASLARLYEEDFKQDMAALKVLPPTAYLRVTEHVPHIVAFIERLIANGHAYCTAKGNVYFDLQSRGDRYGKLVGVAPGPVGEPVDSDKRHTSDFALWKAAKPQEPFWGSPWGDGRPGWHIECSTIASLVFGSQLDIHSGGVDLAFPHHENEIAQCEAFHQCPQWGNYFLHSGHLHVKGGGEKMSKSLKNYVTIKDFLRSTSPDVFRLFCLRSSYRSAIDYSEGALLEARSLLRATAAFVEDARAYLRGQLAGGPIQEDVLWERLGRTKAAVQAALADDFDTVRAVDAVMDLVHHGNRQLKAASEEPRGPRSPAVLGAIVASVEQFFETVGISLAERQCVPGAGSPAALHSLVEELVRFRLKVRQFALASGEAPGEARRQRLLERQPLLEACDALRRDLAVHGISIKDRSSSSTWELLDPRTEDPKPRS
ncbi:probable cysteine--tRNA ligase, mitochondrial isoform X5 [Bos javanicus]|uniref:probable cysteine--tRNA ligase, mitochondrial isoform X5 n=1 Tax=Bos javanicus TaxID=9906 RepID=UPI002AA815B6|nr:probable cysteine--tRNA ligase, mitochondrial isoform X5 [Bos javanicus]